MPGAEPRAVAVDLFCGAGGLTRGLLDVGVQVAAGYDTDPACEFPYTRNNDGVEFYGTDVTELTPRILAKHFPEGSTRILVGCAPCQTFSKYTQGANDPQDPKWNLLWEFGRLIEGVKPEIVSMENVPELRRHVVFRDFLAVLESQGYHFVKKPEEQVVFCPDYGVPQQRRRLVIIASRLGPIKLVRGTHNKDRYRTVRQAIGNLLAIRDGEATKLDPLHRTSRLSDLNLRRVKASKPGGTWKDWPSDLQVKCHRKKKGKGYRGVYGRMEWDQPSPTITTQFYGFGNGRFGHPAQNRGLSLREGAILQSFPRDYEFVDGETEYQFKAIGRLIGNAVPVRLGRAIGRTILKHLEEHHAR